jgi:hypothetical protein
VWHLEKLRCLKKASIGPRLVHAVDAYPAHLHCSTASTSRPQAVAAPRCWLTWRRLVAHAAHVALEAPAAVLPLHEGVHVRAAAPAAHDACSKEPGACMSARCTGRVQDLVHLTKASMRTARISLLPKHLHSPNLCLHEVHVDCGAGHVRCGVMLPHLRCPAAPLAPAGPQHRPPWAAQ